MSAAPDLSYLFRRILLPCSAESVFRGGQICLQEFLSEIVVDQVQDRIQIGRIHLPGRGSLSDCAKGAGTAEDFAAQSADQAVRFTDRVQERGQAVS